MLGSLSALQKPETFTTRVPELMSSDVPRILLGHGAFQIAVGVRALLST
jgi:hypothetical protein